MRIFRKFTTPLLLIFLLAVLFWGARWGWENLTAPLPTAEPTPCVALEVKEVTPKNMSVRVLNGGFTSGLASRVANKLEKGGFQIIKTGNVEARITGTIIKGPKASKTAAEMLASWFTDAAVELDDRVDGTFDVLVGSDFAGYGKEPKTKASTGEAGSICIPPTPESPSASPSKSKAANE